MGIIERLEDPHLVVKVQEFFGIRYTRKDDVDITNKFWYCLFWFGTMLGDEIFYATMIPFWFWNVDSAVARRVVLMWSVIMYVGQVLKDIFKMERPGYPVQKLQKKWALEFGFPSTHAMIALQIPTSVVYFSYQRYDISLDIGIAVSILWCLTVCLSRIYLGMHSILDIIGGLLISLCVCIPWALIADSVDLYLISSPYAPLILLFVSLMLITWYPTPPKWTPTRGDTTLTTSVTVGIYIGAWINYQTGAMPQPAPFLHPPYSILWPTPHMLMLLVVRTVIGLFLVVLTRSLFTKLVYNLVCFVLGRDPKEVKSSANSLENKHKIIAELTYKFISCGMIGLDTTFLVPNLFKFLGIGRPDFYTEV